MGNTTGHKAKVSDALPAMWQAHNGVLAALPTSDYTGVELPEPPQEPAEHQALVYSKTHKRWAAIKYHTHRFKNDLYGKHWRWMAYYAEWEPEAPPDDLLDGYVAED